MPEGNEFLLSMPILELELLIKELHGFIEGCYLKNDELDEDGLIYSEKMEIVQYVYDFRIKKHIDKIVI